MLIQVVVFPGVDELDAIAPFEVLSMAAHHATGWRVELVAAVASESVVTANGLRLVVEGEPLSLNRRPDLLIVPGGGWADRVAVGARAEVASGALPRLIAELHAAGTVIASVCTGAMIVAAAGILKGRPAVTHHLAVADLWATGAQIVEARVVDDEDILTAGGITSGLDLALWIVARFLGQEPAQEIAARLEHERRGPLWQRPKSA